MNARYIKPEELRKIWPFVRAGLEVILKKSPEQWIPEDIYADCFAGRSLLWREKVAQGLSALIRGVKAGIAKLRR